MKYIKTYEYQSHIMSDEELNNIKEYAVIQRKATPQSIFILKIFSKTKDYIEEIQLYHCNDTTDHELIDDTKNYEITSNPYKFHGMFDEYDILFSSDILEDCVDYVNAFISANKFNL